MLNSRDIEFANKINIILKKVEKENQMPNCNFLMKCKILEKNKNLEEDFIAYKKLDMQEWIYKNFDDENYVISNGVSEIEKYFINGVHIKEISYEDMLYSPIDNGEFCSLEHFTAWFYTNDFNFNDSEPTCNLTGISSKRNEVLELVKDYFETDYLLSYYTIVNEPNELSSGNFISHSSHFFVCMNDKILMFEFEMFS